MLSLRWIDDKLMEKIDVMFNQLSKLIRCRAFFFQFPLKKPNKFIKISSDSALELTHHAEFKFFKGLILFFFAPSLRCRFFVLRWLLLINKKFRIFFSLNHSLIKEIFDVFLLRTICMLECTRLFRIIFFEKWWSFNMLLPSSFNTLKIHKLHVEKVMDEFNPPLSNKFRHFHGWVTGSKLTNSGLWGLQL